MKRMIMADDDSHARDALADYMRSSMPHVYVEQVADGNQLVERVRNHTYDLVLTDNEMQELGGLAAIQGIREFNKRVPIIMLAGSSSREEAIKAGATGYVSKSNWQEDLPPVLRDYLGSFLG